jgi:hypothetical protein
MREDGYDVSVSTEFEGANPQTPQGVMREGAADFLIVPSQEEDNPNYKFRMDTLIVNRVPQPRRVTLHVDWRTPTYMEVRDHLFFRSGEGWRRVQGEVAGSFCAVTTEVPPGETWASLNPKYSYSDHLAQLAQLRQRGEVAVRSIGKSAHGRDVFLLSVPAAADRACPTVLVEAGNHPYETSGAYCIQGMLVWLLGPGRAWQDRVAAHFVQVSNPDGVAEGWCRLTGPGGVDVCHEFGISSDPTCVALRGLMAELRPRVYVNIHGWMYNDLDNFRYGDAEAARLFLPCLLGEVGGPVWRWRIQNPRPEEPPVTNTWYARAHYGSLAMGFDIAWNLRTEEQMRALGAALLEAACQAAVGCGRASASGER